MASYTKAQLNIIKQQALLYAQQHEVALLLDNNFTANACNLTQVEFVAAIGVDDFVEVNSTCFNSLDTFLKKHAGKYVFTQLSYDIKNELEQLHSNHPNYVGFAKLIAFVPKQLLVVNAQLEVLEGADLAEFLLQANFSFDTVETATVVMQPKVNKSQYLFDVECIKQHIVEGDVYELNYCMEYYNNQAVINPFKVYDKLKTKSPVPFGAFFKWFDKYLICASPERFMCRKDDTVFVQPIKGTAPRSANAVEDEQHKQALLNSEKERAENLMIVDLMRNDLAITAQTGTVKVEELFGIYSFPQVHQMISTVSSKPVTPINNVEVIKRAFPMGSMTGAPKIMAMQLIERYEQTQRGLYSGAVGYFAPNGNFDFNVVIRSLQYNAQHKYLSYEVGSAITYDSIPEQEYEECLLKAQAMLAVLA